MTGRGWPLDDMQNQYVYPSIVNMSFSNHMVVRVFVRSLLYTEALEDQISYFAIVW